MTGPGERVSGDDRENIAAAVGVAIASVYLTCELGLLAAVTSAVRASLPFGAAVTMPALAKLRRQAAALLAKSPHPSRDEIDQAMNGNICRCATYQRIRRAIQRAATG